MKFRIITRASTGSHDRPGFRVGDEYDLYNKGEEAKPFLTLWIEKKLFRSPIIHLDLNPWKYEKINGVQFPQGLPHIVHTRIKWNK